MPPKKRQNTSTSKQPTKRTRIGNKAATPGLSTRHTEQTPPPAPTAQAPTASASQQESQTAGPALDTILASVSTLLDQRLAPLLPNNTRTTPTSQPPLTAPLPAPPLVPPPAPLAIPVGTPMLNPLAPPLTGTDPLHLLQSTVPWVDTATLTQIVSRTLDAAHLIKLIPPEDRPKGSANTSMPAGITFDLEHGGRPIFTSEHAITAYEKTFPTFPILLQALSVYGSIRSLYDRDSTGLGPAIFLYIRKLATWTAQGFPWKGIILYAIAHFRKHQASLDPLAWIHTDTELFTTHIARPPGTTSSTANAFRSPQPKKEFCRNWNTKGCIYHQCLRLHKCSTCSGDHPAFSCSQASAGSAPHTHASVGSAPHTHASVGSAPSTPAKR